GDDEGTEGAGVLARIADVLEDRRRIARVERVEMHDSFAVDAAMRGEKPLAVAMDFEQGGPILRPVARGTGAVGDVEDARQVLGALDLAGHPEDAVGIAGQQARQAPTCLSTRPPA